MRVCGLTFMLTSSGLNPQYVYIYIYICLPKRSSFWDLALSKSSHAIHVERTQLFRSKPLSDSIESYVNAKEPERKSHVCTSL